MIDLPSAEKFNLHFILFFFLIRMIGRIMMKFELKMNFSVKMSVTIVTSQ